MLALIFFCLFLHQTSPAELPDLRRLATEFESYERERKLAELDTLIAHVMNIERQLQIENDNKDEVYINERKKTAYNRYCSIQYELDHLASLFYYPQYKIDSLVTTQKTIFLKAGIDPSSLTNDCDKINNKKLIWRYSNILEKLYAELGDESKFDVNDGAKYDLLIPDN